MRARWVTIGLTVAAFVAAILASPLVPRQFFPSSDRPELLVDLTPAENASIYASEEAVEPARRLPEGRSRRRTLEHQRRARRDPVLPAARRAAAERLLHPGRGRSPRTSRRASGCRRSWRQFLAEEFPAAVSSVSPLELGPPVGWPVQYRVSGPDLAQVQDTALAARADHRRGRDRQAGELRLDGARAPRPHQHRPGPGAPGRAGFTRHRHGA